MEKKNLIFLSCIIVTVVVLSVIFVSYGFSSLNNIQETSTILSGGSLNEYSNITIHTPKKIGTISIIPGEVQDINIENSKKV